MRVAISRARYKRNVRLVRRAKKEVEFATSHIEVDIQNGTKRWSALAIKDDGSPISMIRRSAISEDCPILQYEKEVRWGPRDVIKSRDGAFVTVHWDTDVRTRELCLIVNDEDLPLDVDMLIGTDIIFAPGTTHDQHKSAEGVAQFRVNNSRWHPLMYNLSQLKSTIARRRTAADEPLGPWLEVARVETEASGTLRLVRSRYHNGTRTSIEDEPAATFNVFSQDRVAIPPRAKRIIVGNVEWNAHTRPRHKVEVLFQPNQNPSYNIWTVQATVDGSNPSPWIPVSIQNLSDRTVFVERNQLLGQAHTEFDAVDLNAKDSDNPEEPCENPLDTDAANSPPNMWKVDLPLTRHGPEFDTGPPMVFNASLCNIPDDMMDPWHFGLEDNLPDWDDTLTTRFVHEQRRDPDWEVGGGETEEDRPRIFLRDFGALEDERKTLMSDFEDLRQRTREQLKGVVSPDFVQRADELLHKHCGMFTEPNIARSDHAGYPFYLRIPVINAHAIRVPPYRYPADKLMALHEWVGKQIQKGHVEPSVSSWNAPIVLARKKDGRWRFAIDLRGLNRVVSFDPYVLPRIPDLLDLTQGAKWFSALDLTDGYWNCLIHPEDREKTAFTIPGHGRYQWRSMPFGLNASGPHFQRCVEAMMAGLDWGEVAVYVDDVLVFTKDFERHLEVLDVVLGRLREGGFMIAPKKCSLFRNRIPYLGHTLSEKGVEMTPEYVDKLKASLLTINSKSDVRTVAGLAQFYAKFIWNFSEIMAPLTNATRKSVTEDLSSLTSAERESMIDAVKQLSKALTEAPILALPNYDREFVLFTDASNIAMGAALCQEDENGTMRPVTLWSRKLSDTEQRYSTTEREALAIVYFLEKFRHYLLGRQFLLVTDHKPLLYIVQGGALNSKLARWSLRIQEFNFDIAHISGPQMVVADALSRVSKESPIKEWNAGRKGMYVRSRNPLTPETDEEIIIPRQPVQITTATVRTVETVGKDKEEATVMDGETWRHEAMEQEEWEFELGEPSPAMYEDHEATVTSNAPGHRINMTELQRTDAEYDAILQILNLPEPDRETAMSNLEMDTAWKSSVSKAISEQRLEVQGGLLTYLEDRIGKDSRVKSDHKRVFVPRVLRRAILYDKHSAPWSAHMGFDKTLARVSHRYWWPTIRAEVEEWVGTCEDCQRAEKGYRKSWGLLKPLQPVERPFERLAMDLIEISPKAKDIVSGNKYALVCTDYATRFAIVVPIPDNKSRTVAAALLEHVIAYFGLPEEILSDNGSEFRGITEALTSMMGIQRSWAAAYHPQTNGLVERFNRTLEDMLTIATEHGAYTSTWDQYIPLIQLAYNTAVQSSTGYSPYFLMYGRHPRSPLDSEIEWSDRQQRKPLVRDWIRRLRDQRDMASKSLRDAQQKQKVRHDRKRKEFDVEVGGHVWLRMGELPEGTNRKTSSALRGPYEVTKVDSDKMWVEMKHMSLGGEPIRVHVERLVPTRIRATLPLSESEKNAIGINIQQNTTPETTREECDHDQPVGRGNNGMIEVEVPMIPTQRASTGAHEEFEVTRIWGHRKDTNDRFEYLVEWNQHGNVRLGTWVKDEDGDFEELSQNYWKQFREGTLQQVPAWRRKCKGNGRDTGCEHLKCRALSWTIAMDEANYVPAQRIEPIMETPQTAEQGKRVKKPAKRYGW